MELKGKFKIKKILRKTQAKLFKDLKVGDEIEIIKELCKEGGAFSGSTASYIIVKDNKGNQIDSTLRIVGNILPCFEWEELKIWKK